MVTGLGMGTLAAQEDLLGDVIQPESGGLSPSDAVNPGLRAGGGARSRPSSGGWGRKRARSLSPHVVFLSGLGGPAGAPRHGRGRLLSCVHSSVPTSPGNTTPQPPQKSRPTWWVMLVNTAPLHGKGSDGSHRPALVLHVSAPRPRPYIPYLPT